MNFFLWEVSKEAILRLGVMFEKEPENMNNLLVSRELIKELWRYFSIWFGVSPLECVVVASVLERHQDSSYLKNALCRCDVGSL